MRYSILRTVDARKQTQKVNVRSARVRDPIVGIDWAMSSRMLFRKGLSPRLSKRDDDLSKSPQVRASSGRLMVPKLWGEPHWVKLLRAPAPRSSMEGGIRQDTRIRVKT